MTILQIHLSMWIKIIFNCFMALGFWLLVLYVRLFREFKNIMFSTKILMANKNLFACLFFVTLIMSIITMISLYLKYKKKNTKNEIVDWILGELHWVFYLLNKFEEMKKDLYTVFFSLTKNYRHYFLFFTKWCLNNLFFFRLLLFTGIILPRFIIIFSLIAEIYVGHLKYFFYALTLLIIPLFIELIIYILKNLKSSLSYMIDEYIIVSDHPPKYVVGLYDKGTQESYFTGSQHVFFKREHAYWHLDSFINNVYLPLINLPNFLETKIMPLYNTVKSFTIFLYFFLQAMSWGYIYFFLI